MASIMLLLPYLAVLSIGFGTGAAVAADHCQEQNQLRLQRLAGGLVVTGFVLIGVAFPLIV